MLDHLMRLSISFCNRVQSSTELSVQYKRISPAYNLIFAATFKGTYRLQNGKRKEARAFPWGTPDDTT